MTPEERAARAEEKLQKKLEAQERVRQEEDERSRILPREWIELRQPQTDMPARRCKVMTWNVRQYAVVFLHLKNCC